jgi:hypothetical protein
MSDEYLWDRSGPPDPEVQELEAKLEVLKHRRTLRLEVLSRAPARSVWWPAAAAIVFVCGAAAWLSMPVPQRSASAWQVADMEGIVRLGGRSAVLAAPLYTGQAVSTGSGSKLTLEAKDFGFLQLAPDSELRVLWAQDGRQRLKLEFGLIHAVIWAPPGRFVVDTPAARATDLGCAYTLSVDKRGDGEIEVETGWVAFEFEGRESFIPAGARCRTSGRSGPGLPVFEDAAEGFQQAVSGYEADPSPEGLNSILAQARAKDALTLWHLLSRVSAPRRGEVFDRFAALVALPPQVNRAGVVALNPEMMDLCWNSLGLENTGWWRGWKQPWQTH